MSEVNSVLSFLYCTLTGVGALLIVLMICGLFLAPIFGAGWLYTRLAASRPKMKYFSSKVLPTTLFIIFAGGVISLVVVAMHDWGCDIHGHPEHKIILDDKPTTSHEHKP